MNEPLRRLDQGELSPLDRLREVSTVGKHHLRLPTLLLRSRNHPATSVAVFLLIDSRSGPASPAVMRREVGAARLGFSTPQWKRAMAPLLRDHNNSKGQEPAFVQNNRRGQGRASARAVVTAAQYVKIPVHSLDKLVAEENGISPKALRLLGAVWELQPKNNDGGTRPPWCEVSAAALAKTAGVSPVTVPALRQELEEAGMVLVDVADGRAAVILPLARELETEEREELTECLRGVLAERDGDRTPYRPRAGKPTTDEATTDDDETTPRNRAVNTSTSGNGSGEPEPRPVEFVERSSAEHRRNLVRGWKTGAAGGQHGATA